MSSRHTQLPSGRRRSVFDSRDATADTDFLVVEMGARGIGHISYLCEIAPPRVAAVLNVGTAHVGEFGGREQIATAKVAIQYLVTLRETLEAAAPMMTSLLALRSLSTSAPAIRT